MMSRKSIFFANRHFPARGATPAADLRVGSDQPAGQAEGRPRRLPPRFARRILLLCGPRLPLKSVSPRTRGRRSDRLKLPSSETTRRRRGWVPPLRNRKFPDLYGSFSVKWFFVVAGFLFGAERPFLVPSPAIRFAERAERCQGTEMLAQLSGLPLSVACVFAAPPVQARGRL